MNLMHIIKSIIKLWLQLCYNIPYIHRPHSDFHQEDGIKMHILHYKHIINKPWIGAVLLCIKFRFLREENDYIIRIHIPAYLPSLVLFNKSVEQLSSSEPSLHCNTPSQRDSSGTHSPLLHLNSAVWSHSGCSFFSPAVSRCRMSYVYVHSLYQE